MLSASLGKVFHKQHVWREVNTWLFEVFPGGKPIGRRGRARSVTGGVFVGDRWRAAKGEDSDQPDGVAA